jgi:membrane protein implicated in regulation of membrane protease activity
MEWTAWWVWCAGAIALGIFEILAPGFIFLGFAVGAAFVGFILLLAPMIALPWALVIFGAVSLIAWLVMRRVFGVRHGQIKHFDTDINEQ